MGVLRPSLQPSIGRFRIEAKLGAGGMGEVYRAIDTHLRRIVALKLLPERFAAEPERLARFEEEARAASALNHPNIVTIYDSGVSDGVPWIAMEYVEGRTLRSLLQEGPLSTESVLPLACQMADVFAKAHESGIVHRDLKPENVIVSAGGLVKILDFGVAKLTRADASIKDRSGVETEYVTAPGIVVGTPEYMSPEQVTGQAVDYRSDQFALGAIVHELLSGASPFRRSSVAETWSAILNFDPPRLDKLRPGLAAPLAAVVARCLSKDPAHRFQSTRELHTALQTIAQCRFAGTRDDGLSTGTNHDGVERIPSVEDAPSADRRGEMWPAAPNAARPARRAKRFVRILQVVALLIPGLAGIGLWLDSWGKKQVELFRLELQGGVFVSNWTEDEIRKGIEYYKRAVALNPNSASAYAGLATGWVLLSDVHISPREAMPRAAASAMKAIQLDDRLVNAHVSLGVVKLQYEWDWRAAEREFKRAIALDPKYDPAHQLYALYLTGAARFDEAQAEMKQALESDPSDDFSLWGLGLCFHFARQFDRAIEQYRRAIGLHPKSHWSHMLLGWSFEQQGRFEEAIAELNLASRLFDNPQVWASLAHAYAGSGRRADAERILADLVETSKRRYVSPYDIAAIYAGLGDKEKTLAWLEKAYEDRSGWLPLWLKVDPKFDFIRSDPRFGDLLRRIGQAG